MKKFILFLCILLSCTAVFAQTDILDGYVIIPYSDHSGGADYYEFRYVVTEDYTKEFSLEEEVKKYLKEVSRAIILTDQTFIGVFMSGLPMKEELYHLKKGESGYKLVSRELKIKNDGKKVQTFTQIAITFGSAIIITHIEWKGKIYSNKISVFM